MTLRDRIRSRQTILAATERELVDHAEGWRSWDCLYAGQSGYNAAGVWSKRDFRRRWGYASSGAGADFEARVPLQTRLPSLSDIKVLVDVQGVYFNPTARNYYFDRGESVDENRQMAVRGGVYVDDLEVKQYSKPDVESLGRVADVMADVDYKLPNLGTTLRPESDGMPVHATVQTQCGMDDALEEFTYCYQEGLMSGANEQFPTSDMVEFNVGLDTDTLDVDRPMFLEMTLRPLLSDDDPDDYDGDRPRFADDTPTDNEAIPTSTDGSGDDAEDIPDDDYFTFHVFGLSVWGQ